MASPCRCARRSRSRSTTSTTADRGRRIRSTPLPRERLRWAPLSTALVSPPPRELERLCLTPHGMLPGHGVHWLFVGPWVYPAALDSVALAGSEILGESADLGT